MSIDRIRTSRNLHAMVALDTVDLIAARVSNLLAHGRRIAIAHRRATYTGQPPELHVGLTLDGVPSPWKRDDGAGMHVQLTAGRSFFSFGFAAYGYDGNATETAAWKRYHDHETDADNYFDRRRDMTEVHIVGGLQDDGPARDDMIVVRHWNRDGVCDERVIGFDYNLDEAEVIP